MTLRHGLRCKAVKARCAVKLPRRNATGNAAISATIGPELGTICTHVSRVVNESLIILLKTFGVLGMFWYRGA